MPGTFIIRPTSIISGGVPVRVGGVAPFAGGWESNTGTLQSILDALLSDVDIENLVGSMILQAANATFTDTIRLSLGGNSIYLDGSLAPIDLTSLPAGFIVTAASLMILADFIPPPPYPPVDGTSTFNIQQATGNNGTLNADTFVYFPILGIADMLGNGIGLKVDLQVDSGGTGDPVVGIFYNFRIEGTYDTLPFVWTIDTPPPINQGDCITMTSDPLDPNALIFTDLTDFTFSYTDNDGVTQTGVPESIVATTNSLVFCLPVGFDPTADGVTFNAILDATPSPIPIVLGTLAVLHPNTSGIYTLTLNKTNDTLYDRDTDDTVDVKIPNPFVRTGYVGG